MYSQMQSDHGDSHPKFWKSSKFLQVFSFHVGAYVASLAGLLCFALLSGLVQSDIASLIGGACGSSVGALLIVGVFSEAVGGISRRDYDSVLRLSLGRCWLAFAMGALVITMAGSIATFVGCILWLYVMPHLQFAGGIQVIVTIVLATAVLFGSVGIAVNLLSRCVAKMRENRDVGGSAPPAG